MITMIYTQAPKKLALISDLTGYGRCSMTVALPVISALQVQACPVPTAIFSNHTAFPTWHTDDYTAHMQDYLHGWEQLGLTFDGIYSSFLGSVTQTDIVSDFIRYQKKHTSDIRIIIDPVMGDHGKAYATITPALCQALRTLISMADLITPNLTEACLLTDSDYTMYAHAPESAPLFNDLIQKLASYGPKQIVITGIPVKNRLRNLIYDHGHISYYETPIQGEGRPGTGDIFASIIASCAVRSYPFPDAVKLAADFIGICTNASHEAGIPVTEGVCFEYFLSELHLDLSHGAAQLIE